MSDKYVYVLVNGIALRTRESLAVKGQMKIATMDDVANASEVVQTTQWEPTIADGSVFYGPWVCSLTTDDDGKKVNMTEDLIKQIQEKVLPNTPSALENAEVRGIFGPSDWEVVLSFPFAEHQHIEEEGYAEFQVEVDGRKYEISVETP